jgi:primosomal protein N' (replication factor Y)
MFAQVALPVGRAVGSGSMFTYAVPAVLQQECRPGMLALVPFGPTVRVGMIWQLSAQPAWSEGTILPVMDLFLDAPQFSDGLYHLVQWMAWYYMQPVGLVVDAALPSHLTPVRRRRAVWTGPPVLAEAPVPELWIQLATVVARPRRGIRDGVSVETLDQRFGRSAVRRGLKALISCGLVRMETRWTLRRDAHTPPTDYATDTEHTSFSSLVQLTDEQQLCVDRLSGAVQTGRYAPFLLQGVTGSGKTEVYFHAVAACLQRGLQVLLLVPEIALTPQLLARCRERFAVPVALFHSGVPTHQRVQDWHRVASGQPCIVIGARSAIFAPFMHLGLVVVDEEHDASYKQEEGVPYHARDMAVVLARHREAVLLLASATPSLESLHNVAQGRYTLLNLARRATGAAMPVVELVDMRQDDRGATHRPGGALVGDALYLAMRENLLAGHQTLLFLNRRGYAPTLLCTRCGNVARCPNCTVSLTVHRRPRVLLCHYCDHTQPLVDVCPACGQLSLIDFGPGIEQLEEEVRRRMPEARVSRLDRDVVSGRAGLLEEILDQFNRGEIDILLGTQILAKGHHFPNLALVGVVFAESGLCQPDFRAAERTFQLITQVAGRSGRVSGTPGRVLVQTFDPDHYAVRTAATHDFVSFMALERVARQDAVYPPECRIALLRLSGTVKEEGERLCHAIRSYLQTCRQPELRVLGPSPAPLFRLRGRFRWQILYKGGDIGSMHRAIHALVAHVTGLLQQMAGGRRLRLDVDIDPYLFA